MSKEITCSEGTVLYTDKFDLAETSPRRAAVDLLLSQFCLTHCRAVCQVHKQGIPAIQRTLHAQEKSSRERGSSALN